MQSPPRKVTRHARPYLTGTRIFDELPPCSKRRCPQNHVPTSEFTKDRIESLLTEEEANRRMAQGTMGKVQRRFATAGGGAKEK